MTLQTLAPWVGAPQTRPERKTFAHWWEPCGQPFPLPLCLQFSFWKNGQSFLPSRRVGATDPVLRHV